MALWAHAGLTGLTICRRCDQLMSSSGLTVLQCSEGLGCTAIRVNSRGMMGDGGRGMWAGLEGDGGYLYSGHSEEERGEDLEKFLKVSGRAYSQLSMNASSPRYPKHVQKHFARLRLVRLVNGLWKARSARDHTSDKQQDRANRALS